MLFSPDAIRRRDRRLLRPAVLLGAFTLLAAIGPAQQLDWVRQFADGGTGGDTWVADVKVTADGHVYVAGTIAIPPVFDCFVRKYDLAGNLKWAQVFGTSGNDDVSALTVEAGVVYVGGGTFGSFPGFVHSPQFALDPFIVTFDTAGNPLTTLQIPRLSISSFGNPSVAFIDASALYVADVVDDGSFFFPNRDVQVVKYNHAGVVQWATELGTLDGNEQVSTSYPRPLSVDTNGVFVTGSTTDAFPGETLTGFEDVFLARLDSAGNLLWVTQSGVANEFTWGSGVAADGAGVYLAHTTQSFGLEVVLNVSRYDLSGNVVWTRELSSVDSDVLFSAIDADGSGVCVAGGSEGTFPGYMNAGGRDVFARRFDADGNEIWTTQFGSAGTDEPYAVAIDGGDAYVGGIARGMLPGGIADGAFLVKVLPPAAVDTDGDGLSDADEIGRGTNPMNPDTDADGALDGAEVALAAGGGCPNPLAADSDGDSLSDGTEINVMGTSPCLTDTDGDSVPDNLDPEPLVAGSIADVVEAILLDFADTTTALPVDLFVGPNANSQAAKRNAVADRFRDAAEAADAGNLAEVLAELRNLLKKLDPTKNGAWMLSSSAQQDLYDSVALLISFLGG